MFNWSGHMRGAGFPMPPQMLGFPGAQTPFPGQPMSFQTPPPTWPQQPGLPPGIPGMGMMIGQPWPPHGQPPAFPPPGMGMPLSAVIGTINPPPPMLPPPEDRPPLPAEPPPPLPTMPKDQPQQPPLPQDQPKPPPPTPSKSKWDQPTRESQNTSSQLNFNVPLRGSPGQIMPPRGPPPVQPTPPLGPPPNQPLPPRGPPPVQPGPPSSSASVPPQPPPPEKPLPGSSPSQPGPPPSPTVASQPPPPDQQVLPDPQIVAKLESVKQEEAIFLEQYKQWKKQYDDWREQNQNHPNKEQFEQYLDQWKTYEQQMEARRKSIESQKQSLEKQLNHPAALSSEPADSKAKPGWLGNFVPTIKNEDFPYEDQNPSQWDRGSQNDPTTSQNIGSHFNSPGSQNFTRTSKEREINLSHDSKKFGLQMGNFSSGPPGNPGGSFFQGPMSDSYGNVRFRGQGSFGPTGRNAGPQDEEKGEEDMNLDDEEEEEGGGGEIIHGGNQAGNNIWQSKPPPKNNWQDSNSQSEDWNSWNRAPFPPGHGQWNNQSSNVGGFPGPRFQNEPVSGWPNQRGGPRGFRGGPDNFRGRGRGEWNSGNMGFGPRFGGQGSGMNQGPRFSGPNSTAETEQANDQFGQEGFEQEDTFWYEDQAEQGSDKPENNQYDLTTGIGERIDRGRGQSFRGRGGEFPRGRGMDFNRGRGGDFQRGRVADIARGRGAEFQQGRESNFGLSGEFQLGKGSDFQRGRGGRMYNDGSGAELFELEGDPPRGPGGLLLQGQNRGGGPPSLMSFEFSESMKDKFADFDPAEVDRDEKPETDNGKDYADDTSFGFGERGRGQNRGGMRGREAGGFQNFNQDIVELGGEREFSQRGMSDWDRQGMDQERGVSEHGRGLLNSGRAGFEQGHGGFDQGRGGFDRGRGGPRGRGGFGFDPLARNDGVEELQDNINFGPRGGGNVRGRGGVCGRGGFNNQEYNEQDFEDTFDAGFGQRGRGRRMIQGRRGRGNFNSLQSTDQLGDAGNEFQNDDGFGAKIGAIGRGQGAIVQGRVEGMGPGQPDYGSICDEQRRKDFPDEYDGVPIQQELKDSVDNSQNAGRSQSRGRLPDDEEPEAKKARLTSDIGRDDRILPPFSWDSLDSYTERLGDPYFRDRERYLRDPYLDPYAPLPPYGFNRPIYDRFSAVPSRYDLLSERKPFVPAESIDYAHGGVAAEKKSSQPAEVIDYGHGQTSDHKHSDKTNERERATRLGLDNRGRELPGKVDARGYPDTQSSGREWPSGRDGLDSSRVSKDQDFDMRRLEGIREHDSFSRGFSYARGGSPGGQKGSDWALLGSSNKPSYLAGNKEEKDLDLRMDQGRFGERDIDSRDRHGGVRYGDSDNFGGSRFDSREGDSDNYGGSRFDSRDEDFRSKESGVDSRKSYTNRRDDRHRENESVSARESDSDYRRGEDYYGRGGDSYGSKLEDSFRRNSEYNRNRGDEGRDSDAHRDRYRDNYSGPSREGRFGGFDDRDSGHRGDRYGRALSPLSHVTPPLRPSIADVPSQSKAETVKIEDLLCSPGRASRPPQIVTIIRGLPGSGKTYVSKLIREKELGNGGAAPRMLCLDDYFMVEVDKEVVDPDSGKKVKKKVMEYEYEQALEESYRQSLLKSFKKTVDDGFFPFIILDATNEKVVHFSEFWSYAKSKGFQVYVGELKVDVSTCIQRNIHHWTEWDIEKVKNNWEPLPSHYIRLDLRWLLQEDSIPEVVMEDSQPDEPEQEKKKEEEEEEEEQEPDVEGIYKKSRWELDTSEETLDKLDGIRVSKKHIAEHQSLNEYLQLDQMDDDYFSRESLPGKKRVRWADLEEKKNQSRRRDLGFIVGQTQQDWERITDDDFAIKALNQTKYFFKN